MIIIIPIGSMYGIYANIYHQYTPNVSIYIPAPWILWDSSGEGNLCLIHPGRAARAQKDPGLLQLRRSRRRELDSFFFDALDLLGCNRICCFYGLKQVDTDSKKRAQTHGTHGSRWARMGRHFKIWQNGMVNFVSRSRPASEARPGASRSSCWSLTISGRIQLTAEYCGVSCEPMQTMEL
jgi:hypothetical protein